MIIEEFSKDDHYEYKTIKFEQISALAKLLSDWPEFRKIIDEVGLIGSFDKGDSKKINQKIYGFAETNSLLKAFEQNFSISIALARYFLISGEVKSDQWIQGYVEDKFFNLPQKNSGYLPQLANQKLPSYDEALTVALDMKADPVVLDIVSKFPMNLGDAPSIVGKEPLLEEEFYNVYQFKSKASYNKFGWPNRTYSANAELYILKLGLFPEDTKYWLADAPEATGVRDPNLKNFLLSRVTATLDYRMEGDFGSDEVLLTYLACFEGG